MDLVLIGKLVGYIWFVAVVTERFKYTSAMIPFLAAVGGYFALFY